MQDVQGFLRSGFALLDPDEALRASAGALIGVDAAAATALASLDVHSIFDLAASRIFGAAAKLLALQRDATAPETQLNVVASDVAALPGGVSVRDLALQPIRILRAIGDAAPAIEQSLDVKTIRDLALWPPYHAAKAILGAAYLPEQVDGFDPEAPADLLPKSGVYPTERVFFRKLVIDAVPEQPNGAQPIEQAPAIDLNGALAAPTGFNRMATGALLTFSQSWFSEGVTLGQLLHSTSLAPGESTRIAVVDWSRRSRAAASEAISETELLSNTMTHSRAISEVTEATATEVQRGRSRSHATSNTEQGGLGFGLDLGPIGFGGSGSTSTTTTDVVSSSSSFGARELAASYAQDINDRSQQNASSVRNRRASIVREVSQSEHEQISTRVITNYNHMHALSIQYYEVVQAYRTTTQLERAERCLFVPVKLVDFSDAATLDRWRLTLAGSALTQRTRRQLTVEYGVVEIIPQTPRVTMGSIVLGGFDVAIEGPSPGPGPAPGPTPAPAQKPVTVRGPAAVLAVKGWDFEQLNRIGWGTGRIMMQAGSDSVFISDDARLVGFSLRDGVAARFVLRRRDGGEVTPAAESRTSFTLSVAVPIAELESIAVQFAAAQLRTSMVLQLDILGTVMPLDVPIQLRPMSVPAEVVKFGSATAASELIAHLQANRLHYTQAILRELDAATIAALLSRFTYRGLPLAMLVDTQPVAVTANFLVFKINVATTGNADDPRWAEEQQAWRNWLRLRGLDRPAPKTEIIALPSGGVFAEAVLGRYNSAEKMDLTRFWNWQDSPIPLSAPEIAPLQAGTRAQSDEIKPGQLSAPVLNIQTPTTLPDAAGIAAIIAAVQNGNLFRDMSGMAQTAALAQAALQASAAGATSAGDQAAQNLKTVVDANTERMRIAAQLATGVPATGSGGGGGATGNRPAKNVTEEGARLNHARELDKKGGGSSSAPAPTATATEVPSPLFAPGGDDEPPPSVERSLFDRQTGGVAATLANAVAFAPGGGVSGSSSPSYDRAGALEYARKFWNVVCDDRFIALKGSEKFRKVPAGTTFVHEFHASGQSSGSEHALLPDGTRIEWDDLEDCTHFISCCIGERPGQPCGGLPIRYKQLGEPPTDPYGIVRADSMVNYLTGRPINGKRYAKYTDIVAEKTSDKSHISKLQPGDIIAYFNESKNIYYHLGFYLGDDKIACHTYCRSDLPACTWDNSWDIADICTFLRFIV